MTTRDALFLMSIEKSWWSNRSLWICPFGRQILLHRTGPILRTYFVRSDKTSLVHWTRSILQTYFVLSDLVQKCVVMLSDKTEHFLSSVRLDQNQNNPSNKVFWIVRVDDDPNQRKRKIESTCGLLTN